MLWRFLDALVRADGGGLGIWMAWTPAMLSCRTLNRFGRSLDAVRSLSTVAQIVAIRRSRPPLGDQSHLRIANITPRSGDAKRFDLKILDTVLGNSPTDRHSFNALFSVINMLVPTLFNRARSYSDVAPSGD